MPPTEPAPSIAPGTILGSKYVVESVLGRGAMGLVVAARHVDLGESFAIKLLVPGAVTEPKALDRFLLEARAAARLKSEHVAKVTDVGRLADGSPYMVMEHLDGTDFHRILRQSGPLPIGDALLYVWQACDAIAEAHAAGIIHRDIKPANLFLTHRRNGSPCVKVLDFGISKQAVDGGVELTRTGEIWGTPIYMAPERMARSQFADARSDIWSIGLVLYELLTRVRPFHAPSVTEVVARVLQEEAPPPSTHRPEIPPPVDAIVQRCLQKRPDDRFQTVDDLARALQAVLTSTTTLDSPSAARHSSSPALAPVANPRPAPVPVSTAPAPVATAPAPFPAPLTPLPGAPAPPAAASAPFSAASVPLAAAPASAPFATSVAPRPVPPAPPTPLPAARPPLPSAPAPLPAPPAATPSLAHSSRGLPAATPAGVPSTMPLTAPEVPAEWPHAVPAGRPILPSVAPADTTAAIVAPTSGWGSTGRLATASSPRSVVPIVAGIALAGLAVVSIVLWWALRAPPPGAEEASQQSVASPVSPASDSPSPGEPATADPSPVPADPSSDPSASPSSSVPSSQPEEPPFVRSAERRPVRCCDCPRRHDLVRRSGQGGCPGPAPCRTPQEEANARMSPSPDKPSRRTA
ncbi:MAG: protein kinase [Polyangiaceae bacterium]